MNARPNRSGESSGFYSSTEWFKARQKALARDGWRCTNCGASVRGKGLFRVDHILPRLAYPALSLSLPNLRTLCIKCDNALSTARGQRGADARPGVDESGFTNGWK